MSHAPMRTLGTFVVMMVIAGGCAGDPGESEGVITSTTPTVTTVTTAATTTTQPPLDLDVFLGIVNDPAFSAHLTVERTATVGGLGVITQTGEATWDPSGSSETMTSDFSGLDAYTVDALGRLAAPGTLIGPGALEVSVQSVERPRDPVTVQVAYGSDILLSSEWDELASRTQGVWVPARPGTSALGVVSAVLGAGNWEELGAEQVDGQIVHHLVATETVARPLSEIYLLDEADDQVASGQLHIWVASDGVPVAAELELSAGSDTSVTRAEFDAVGERFSADQRVLRLPLSLLGHPLAVFIEGSTDMPERVVEFDIRSSWEFLGGDQELQGWAPRDGVTLNLGWGLIGADSDDGLTTDELMDGLIHGSIESSPGVVQSIENVYYGGFPGRLVTWTKSDTGSTAMTFLSDLPFGLVAFATWFTVDPQIADDRVAFETVLRTYQKSPDNHQHWLTAPRAVVAAVGSLGDTELQADTRDQIQAAATELDPACSDVEVAFVHIVGGDDDGWLEHWYTKSCGATLVWRVVYQFGSNGTDYAISPLPLAPETANTALTEIRVSELITEAQLARIGYVAEALSRGWDPSWVSCSATVLEQELTDAQYLQLLEGTSSFGEATELGFGDAAGEVANRCGSRE